MSRPASNPDPQRRPGQVGLIGWPVEHSVSPAMHNAAFRALGLDWRYRLLPAPPGKVKTALHRLVTQGLQGANVTVPHKQAVMPYLHEVTGVARDVGAVNTIVLEDGRLVGHNTDVDGFLAALRYEGFEPEEGGDAVVVGAGGSARAVVFGLLWSGTRRITVLNRSADRAQDLASGLGQLHSGWDRVQARPLTHEMLVTSAGAAALLVNATSVGMWPELGESIWPAHLPIPAHLAVFDLVYNPQQTLLLRQAEQSGARPVGGLEMLVQQGVKAFELWTGKPAPVEVMRAAAAQALEALKH